MSRSGDGAGRVVAVADVCAGGRARRRAHDRRARRLAPAPDVCVEKKVWRLCVCGACLSSKVRFQSALSLSLPRYASRTHTCLRNEEETRPIPVAALEGAAKRMYELISRKVFSLPKLALLPSVVVAHPAAFFAGLPRGSAASHKAATAPRATPSPLCAGSSSSSTAVRPASSPR